MVAVPNHGWRVVVTEPDGRERSVELQPGQNGPVAIGRAPENDLQIISPYISRRHANVWAHEDGVVFQDLHSTSGTYKAGARVAKTLLHDGESLTLGSPDGIRLAVHELDVAGQDTAEHALEGDSGTEVVRVAALQDSVYLNSTDQVIPAFARQDTRVPQYKRMESRLRAMISLTNELMEVRSSDELCELLLDQVLDQMPVERGMVLLDGDGSLVPRVWGVLGQRETAKQTTLMGPISLDADPDSDTSADGPVERPQAPFTPIRTVTERVYSEGVGMLTLDAARDQRLEGSKSVVMQSIRSIFAAPIASARRVWGVIYVDTHKSLRKDHEDALEWLVAVAHQAGGILERIAMAEEQRKMLESMMRGLAASIDARDGLTAGHSARVAHYSVGTARSMGLSVEEQYTIYYAALLHDYGKIGIDDAVLKKPGRLTPEEYDHIKLHPKYSYDILSKIDFPEDLKVLPMMAATHHERMDGKGYPFGLAGDQIPLAGRIIAIADVYDSLTRKRHYREPMPIQEVLDHLEEGRGDRFCPKSLDAFMAYHGEVLAMREERRLRKRSRSHDLADEATAMGPAALEALGEQTMDAHDLTAVTRDESELETAGARRPLPATGPGAAID
jgi:response regulator RpfG family c-di-GMP phosphodiesterase